MSVGTATYSKQLGQNQQFSAYQEFGKVIFTRQNGGEAYAEASINAVWRNGQKITLGRVKERIFIQMFQ